jgi:hypothetical protein
MLKFTGNGTCQYINQLGLKAFKEILNIFANVCSNSCLAATAISIREGLLALSFFPHHTPHTPISHSIIIHRWK